MLDKLKSLFGAGAGTPAEDDTDALHLAAAALLVEVGRQDGEFDGAEHQAAIASLIDRFGLETGAAQALIEAAEAALDETHQWFGFTRTIADRYEPEQRVELIEMLWEVVLADGVVDDFEDSMVRRVAGLLHVPDRERGAARKRVAARLGVDL